MRAIRLVVKILGWTIKTVLWTFAIWIFLAGALMHLLVLQEMLSPKSAAVGDEIQDTLVDALGCVGDPCVIDDNPGGNALMFGKAAKLVHNGIIKQVVINGRCASACAYFADKARPHVCITKNAVLGFHKGWIGDREDRVFFDLIHSADIQSWVMKKGGYPENGMLLMRYGTAKKFWPTCSTEDK